MKDIEATDEVQIKRNVAEEVVVLAVIVFLVQAEVSSRESARESAPR